MLVAHEVGGLGGGQRHTRRRAEYEVCLFQFGELPFGALGCAGDLLVLCVELRLGGLLDAALVGLVLDGELIEVALLLLGGV